MLTKYHRWLTLLGDTAYAALVRLNVLLSGVRRTLGVPGYWSLSGYAKRKAKSAVGFIFDFGASVVRNVRERGIDGVICGHIHSATIRALDGVMYINCGDWVDSCTAIVEGEDGRMDLVHWDHAAEVAASATEQASIDLPATVTLTRAEPAALTERKAA